MIGPTSGPISDAQPLSGPTRPIVAVVAFLVSLSFFWKIYVLFIYLRIYFGSFSSPLARLFLFVLDLTLVSSFRD